MDSMTADYNGWADQPEEEREALDQIEMTLGIAASELLHLTSLPGPALSAAGRENFARSTA
jgi:hypothetical protein